MPGYRSPSRRFCRCASSSSGVRERTKPTVIRCSDSSGGSLAGRSARSSRMESLRSLPAAAMASSFPEK